MQGISLFVVLAIAAVSGQYIFNGANLPVNGGSAIGATNDYPISYLYSVYIPANTLVFNFTVTSASAPGSTDSCSYYTAVKNYGFPCDYVSGLPSGTSICQGYTEIGGTSNGSPDTYTYTAASASTAQGFSNERIHLPSNNYFFIQIYSYSTGNCGFTITTSSSNCSALSGGVGQIGASYASTSSEDASSVLGSEYCVAPTSIPNAGSNFVVANATGPLVYNATLPLNTAYVNVTFTFAVRDNVAFSGTSFYVYANAGHAGADNSNSYCYESASSNTTASFQCTYTPAGPFFVQVYPSLSSTNPRSINYYGNITILPVVCAAGTIGPKCQPISFDPSPLLTGSAVNATVPASSEYFIYLDVPSAVIGTNFTLYYTGSASLTLSRSFVSTYTFTQYDEQELNFGSSSSSPLAIIHLAEFDLNNFFGGFDTSNVASLKLAGVPIRFYFSFSCSGSTACPISLSAAVQQTVTTGATGSSTASTASASTASASTASASTNSASTNSASTNSASTNSASTASVSTTHSASTASTASASTTRGTTAAAATTGSSSTIVASFAIIAAIIAMMF